MCQAKKITHRLMSTPGEPKMNGSAVLQPKKSAMASPPESPKLPSPRGPPALKRQSSVPTLRGPPKSSTVTSSIKKPKKSSGPTEVRVQVAAPGSIAAARREEVAMAQERRKSKIAHYGRAKPVPAPLPSASAAENALVVETEPRRCSYITSLSEPIYVAYHDEEWGVPVHDDKLLFELLVLTGAQAGSDWTSVLKKRETFREAFSGYDTEAVSKFNEKKIMSISTDYGIELGLVRAAVDNANRILEVKKGFGTFAEYLWRFVSHKPISTQYKQRQRIPVKTSKSEGISKDLVRRGFRSVGPTTIHSFMQAAGLINDHLTTCPRHRQCLIKIT